MILSTLMAGAPALAQESGPQVTSCLINISLDPDILQLSEQTAEHLISTAQQAAQEEMGITITGDFVKFEPAGSWGTLKLSVPNTGNFNAKEFLVQMTGRLHVNVLQAHRMYERQLAEQIAASERRRDDAQAELDRLLGRRPRADAIGTELDEQLNTTVDLSELYPEMSFRDALEVVRNSVDPPLQITVLWRDLEAETLMTPDDPIQIEGLREVRLNTALELLLEAISGEMADVTYEFRDNVIVIASAESLGTETLPDEQPAVQVDVGTLLGRRGEIVQQIQGAELEQAGMRARRRAIEEQIGRTRVESEDLLANDAVTGELERLLKLRTDALELVRRQVEAGQIPVSGTVEAEEDLARARIEMARRREELMQSAGGGRLEDLNRQLSEIAIDSAETDAIMETLRRHLAEVDTQLAQAAALKDQADRTYSAKQTRDLLERQVRRLQEQLARLNPPLVTIIGPD
jgi:hypothetical protein